MTPKPIEELPAPVMENGVRIAVQLNFSKNVAAAFVRSVRGDAVDDADEALLDDLAIEIEKATEMFNGTDTVPCIEVSQNIDLS